MNEEALEALKHKNAKELELMKWKYKKEELSYLEAGQHLRSLNQQLWQVPSMIIAITGGLWYAASTIDDFPRTLALYFTAVVNILTIPIILRLRKLIGKHISFQLKFNKQSDSKGNYTVITCWILLLLTATSLSITGACNAEKFNTKSSENTLQITNNYLYPEKIEVLKK